MIAVVVENCEQESNDHENEVHQKEMKHSESLSFMEQLLNILSSKNIVSPQF